MLTKVGQSRRRRYLWQQNLRHKKPDNVAGQASGSPTLIKIGLDVVETWLAEIFVDASCDNWCQRKTMLDAGQALVTAAGTTCHGESFCLQEAPG